ncbi:DEAD/DEAH box helicase family protein [Patescibacteria group bacterium]|nr:DEAD/DEAH box helicase family protein [Patescibacteria group bacterium]
MQEEEKSAKQLSLFSAFDTIPLLDEFDREYELKVMKGSAIMKAMAENMGYGMTSEHRMLRSPAVHLTSDMLEPQSFEARPYTIQIVQQALRDNSLIILPTGLGKTYAGILLAIETLKINVFGKILLLAPTKPLCEQHQETFSTVLPKLTTEFLTGKISAKRRPEMWQKSNIIIATPQTITQELYKKTGVGEAMQVSLLLIDEAHHTTGDYDYVSLAQYYQKNNPNVLIAGFTASPDSDISKLEKLQKHLGIPDDQILARSYDSPDVKPYVFIRFIKPIFIEKNPSDQQRKFKTQFIEILTRSFKRLSKISGESLIDYAHRNDAGKIVGIKITAFNGLMKRLQKLLGQSGYNEQLGYAMIDWAMAMKIGNAIDRLDKGMPEFIFFMQKQFAEWHKKSTPSGRQFVNHPTINKIMSEVITPPIRKKLHIELTAAIERLGELLNDNMLEYSYRNDLGQSTTVYKKAFKELGDLLKSELKLRTINQRPVELIVEKLIAWSLISRIQSTIDCLNAGIPDLVNYLIYENYNYQTIAQPSSKLFIESNTIRQIMAWLVHYNLWKERNYPGDLWQDMDIGGEVDWEEAWFDPKLRAIADIVDGLQKKQMLIFVKYRDTLRKVMRFLKYKYPDITCERLTGTSNNYGDPGMKQKEQKEVLKKYKNNEIQILVSTSIGEEGLDFPAVDELIFYEPISDVRRHIQRLGRTGRRKHGKVHILIYKDSGEESIYYTSRAEEKAVRKIIKYYQYKSEQKKTA